MASTACALREELLDEFLPTGRESREMLGVLERLAQHWWCRIDDLGHDIPLTDINQLNALGEAPIHIAAWKGTVEDVRSLLEHGANANQRGDFEMTPLHYAYMGRSRENIKCLLEGGADPTLRCDRGLLPEEGRDLEGSL
jgi:hypothetical protein